MSWWMLDSILFEINPKQDERKPELRRDMKAHAENPG